MSSTQIEKALSTEEVGELIGANRNRVYELVKLGYLKSFKVGRCYRFRPEDVRAFMEVGIGEGSDIITKK